MTLTVQYLEGAVYFSFKRLNNFTVREGVIFTLRIHFTLISGIICFRIEYSRTFERQIVTVTSAIFFRAIC